LVSRHREPLITSPGLTGMLIFPASWAQRWLMTFCPESTVISMWTSRKPRPTKVWKLSKGPNWLGMKYRSGTVQVMNREMNGSPWPPGLSRL